MYRHSDRWYFKVSDRTIQLSFKSSKIVDYNLVFVKMRQHLLLCGSVHMTTKTSETTVPEKREIITSDLKNMK